MIETSKKNPQGAPSKYQQTFAQKLVDHMAFGHSFESFAGVVGVTKKTLYNWEEEFPEFLHARELGLAKSLLFFEKIGLAGLFEEFHPQERRKKFNTNQWQFLMKHMHKWTENNSGIDLEKPITLVYLPKSQR